jgi:hypothetical protein
VNLPGGNAPAPQAPTPGPGRPALAGAAATGPSAGPSPSQPTVTVTGGRAPGSAVRPQRTTSGARITRIRVSRVGDVVTVRFRVDRTTKVRVTVRDRRSRVVGRSRLRTVAGGRTASIHVTVRHGSRGPLKVTVARQPESRAPKKAKEGKPAGGG